MIVRALDQDLEDFINSLERSVYSKTFRHFDLLSKFGNRLRMPYSKALGRNLFELRIRGKQEIRIFYTFHNNDAVLLHGFIKKTQSTPPRHLKIAKEKMGQSTTI